MRIWSSGFGRLLLCLWMGFAQGLGAIAQEPPNRIVLHFFYSGRLEFPGPLGGLQTALQGLGVDLKCVRGEGDLRPRLESADHRPLIVWPGMPRWWELVAEAEAQSPVRRRLEEAAAAQPLWLRPRGDLLAYHRRRADALTLWRTGQPLPPEEDDLNLRDLPQEGPSLAADEDEVIWGSYARLLGPLLNDGTWLEGRESMAPLFRGTPLETRSSLMKTLYRDHLPRVEHVLGCDPSLIWIWETWAHMITTVKSQAPANFLKHLVPCPVWEEQPIGPGLVRFAEKARQVGAWEILKHRVERALSRYIFQLQCSPSPKWDSQIHTGGGFRAWYLERLLEPAVEACIHLGHLDLVERWVKGLKAAPPVWIPLVGRAIGVARRLKRNDLVTRWEGLSPSGVFRAPERFLTTGSPVVAFQGQAPPTLEQSPLVAVRLKEGSDPDEAYRQALGWRDSHPRYAVMCSDRGLLLQGGPWPPREEWQAQLEALGLGGFISRLERLIQRHPDQLEARCLLVELLAHPQSWPRELDQERQDQRRTAIIGHLNKVIEVLPMALVVKLPVWGHLPITLSYSPFFQSQEHVFHGMRHWVPSVMASLTRQPEHPQLWGMAFVLHGMTGSPSLPELERMLPGPEVLPLSKLGPELTAMSAAVSHTEREPRYLAWVTRLWEKYRIEGGRPNPEAWEHLGKRLVRYYEDREKKAEAEALAQEWERITR